MHRSHLAPVDAAGKRALLHVQLAAQARNSKSSADSPAALKGAAGATANGRPGNGLVMARPTLGSSHQLTNLTMAEQSAGR
jgi:hypothetical protein